LEWSDVKKRLDDVANDQTRFSFFGTEARLMTVNETKRGDMPKVKDAMTFCDRFAKIVDKHVMLGKRCVNKTLNLHSLSHARAQEIHFDKSRPANKRNYFEGKGVSEMAARVGLHMVSRPPPSVAALDSPTQKHLLPEPVPPDVLLDWEP